MHEAQPVVTDSAIAAFIARWAAAQSAERANYALFLTELCDILGVPRPDPASDDTEHNAYVFERAVPLHQRDGKSTVGRIDLYRRGCFVLEAKQYAEQAGPPDLPALDSAPPRKFKIARGSEAWDDAMLKARGQADRYARSLPAGEPTPPFLLVVDVGHVFELYADFTQQGKAYLPFPDARANRIRLADLRDPGVRARLRAIWLEPLTLDPSKISAAVTREVSRYLAELAKLFEKKHDPAAVAAFLSRCLFCMFAEDVDLLPRKSFTALLESVKGDPAAAVPLLHALFDEMNRGGYSLALRQTLLHFNGGLFADSAVLPLDGAQLGLLIEAAKQDWKHVEPAIFGTLLERALDPGERHKLGAHYTPRAYVERLVLPTVIEPLREEWERVRTAAVTLAGRGDLKGAIRETRAYHHRLCAVRVLDPACGSGNFLYVALEHLKRLEGEVLRLLEDFGENMRLDLGGESVDPHQFLGLELNPRAATIAELVLWIGYLQWHHRNRGATEWPQPVLRAFKNIECRDAVLAYNGKPEPITWQMAYANRKLPGLPQGGLGIYSDEKHGFICETRTNSKDEPYSCPIFAYDKPRIADWPAADFIVGNPPFIGNKRMRDDLGGGYSETLRRIYPAELDGADFVMFWWHKAAVLTREGKCRRFGFITTNSVRQTSNRRVMQAHLGPILEDDSLPLLSLRMAIPDHPWVESADGAAVRIAITVAGLKKPDRNGELSIVTEESTGSDGEVAIKLATKTGHIHPDLTIGADLGAMPEMLANKGISFMGVSLFGQGFLVGEVRKNEKRFVRPYIIGRDLNQLPESKHVIDFFGLSADQAREEAPSLYDQVLRTVKPVRDTNNRAGYREKWWLYGEQRTGLRNASAGLARYVVTCRTAKHRLFMFVPGETIIESTIIGIPTDDAFHLGVLSSRIHVVYSLAAGGRLGIGNDPRYNNSLCFDPFPFPDCTEKQKEKIRALAEELDA
ncbi:MAG: class I SAM-dependent DNA methyltransferase, partial [Verrucomicrobia bacterium]|nr:class I SAM-dependent DNA methyltransferase [Verrucomicrobiota bacterium]